MRAGGKSQAEWDEFSQFVMKASEELGIEVASLDIADSVLQLEDGKIAQSPGHP